ncbi:MAG: hypothetical protein JXR31_15640 [Prolixibacteraceae bacterium]|nr:hypothetical protein [Prolixibacteraceae bacterium]MBN2775687.1 hypothetical protein [Prolixibacteraceae bacterium]
MKFRRYLTIAFLSASLIGLELVWTRIFSAEFYYTFSFLILSLAIMGLGLGSLFVRIFKQLSNIRFISSYIAMAAIFALASPVIIFKLNLNFATLFTEFNTVLKFLASIILLSSSFFFGGMSLALLLKVNAEDIPKLYMADLIGAGLCVAVTIILMNVAGTQSATFLISVPLIIAAVLAPGKKFLSILPLLLFVFLIGKSDSLLRSDKPERAPVIYEHWDAMAKIKLYEYAPTYRGLNIDNLANSPVIGFDGNFNNPDWQGYDIDVKNLIERFDSCTFLSLGAGGGMDVLQALVYGATEVHAVEVNPQINKMLTKGDPLGYIIPDSIENKKDFKIITCNDFSGNLYNDPRVKVVSEDARSYIRRFKNKFDVIYSLSSNTWAALGSGSFAFAENYIFTKEAFMDYWNALSDNGFLSMEHQMYMPRLVSSLTEALKELKVENPEKHFVVYNIPGLRRNLLLLSKQPVTPELIENAYGLLANGQRNAKEPLFPKPDTAQNNLINNIVVNGWKAELDSAAINITPSTDNRPFVAQLGKWENFSFSQLKQISVLSDFQGFPLTKSLLIGILLIIIVLVVPLLFLPYAVSKEKLRIKPWLYFFLLGMAYMIIEVVLMQKFSLFIGASFYSISTVLLTMLVASGVGSRYAEKFKPVCIFGRIIVILILIMLLFNPIVGLFEGFSIFWRSVITAIIISPLGFFMGMPFPRGGLRIKELIDWGFAVNGIASVLGSTAIMLVVFAWGFNAALIIGAILYLLAFLLFRKEKGWA